MCNAGALAQEVPMSGPADGESGAALTQRDGDARRERLSRAGRVLL